MHKDQIGLTLTPRATVGRPRWRLGLVSDSFDKTPRHTIGIGLPMRMQRLLALVSLLAALASACSVLARIRRPPGELPAFDPGKMFDQMCGAGRDVDERRLAKVEVTAAEEAKLGKQGLDAAAKSPTSAARTWSKD